MSNPIQHNFFLMIPATLADDPEIDDSTAMLFGRIAALSNQKGYCWASDEYLAELTHVKTRVISDRLKTLEDKGYIVRETRKNGFQWDRRIFPVFGNKIFSTKGTPVPFETARPCPSKQHARAEYIDKPNNINEIYKLPLSESPSLDESPKVESESSGNSPVVLKNKSGKSIEVSCSDIFRRFCNTDFTTEEIQEAIAIARHSDALVGDPYSYLTGIMSNKRKKPHKSNKDSKMPQNEQEPMLETEESIESMKARAKALWATNQK